MTRLSALFAIFLLALTLGRSGVAAQDTGMSDPFNIEELEGVQAGVLRTYTIDYEAMMSQASTPGADMSNMEMPTGLLALTGGVIQFDNDDNASKGYDGVADTAAEAGTAGMDAEPEEVDLGLGDKSKSFKVEQEIEGQKLTVVFTIVQKDEFIYIGGASGSEIDAEQITKDFTNKLIDGDTSDDDAQFNEDGTSTGGLWNKFPAGDDDLVKGLTPMDQQLYPVTDDASTPQT